MRFMRRTTSTTELTGGDTYGGYISLDDKRVDNVLTVWETAHILGCDNVGTTLTLR